MHPVGDRADERFHGDPVGNLESWTDSELLQCVARNKGNPQESAYTVLVQRHAPRLRRVCRGLVRNAHDAEDLVQATFMVLFRRSETIRDADSLASWLHGVARRLAVSVRHGEQRSGLDQPGDFVEDTRGSKVAPSFEDEEFVPILYEEVQRLPEHYRDPILLHLEGKSHEESAERLRVPVGTIKGRLSRARGLLRDRLVRRGVAIAILFGVWRTPSASAFSSTSEKTSSSLSAAARTAGRSLPRRTVWLIVVLLLGLMLVGIQCQRSPGSNQEAGSKICGNSEASAPAWNILC